MVERIERTAGARGASYDRGRSLEDRSGFSDGGGGEGFRDELEKVMRKKARAVSDPAPVVTDPYVVNVTRATHSLFYKDGSAVVRIGKKVDEDRP